MNRDDIIRMAQECYLIGVRPHLDGIYQESLERFAALVAASEREAVEKAVEQLNRLSNEYRKEGHIFGDSIRTAVAAEREACARVCEDIDGTEPRACAAAIRARGE